MSIDVAVVDDHHMFREGLVGLLEMGDEFRVTAQGSTSCEAIAISSRLEPELLLLDVDIDEHPAPTTVRAVVRASPSTKIVMLTMHSDEILAHQLLGAGATGFLSKALTVTELKAALHDIATSSVNIDDARRRSTGSLLSARELEVLRLVAAGQSNRDIAHWLTLADGTVKRHISNIFTKLNARSRMDAVVRAERLGFRVARQAFRDHQGLDESENKRGAQGEGDSGRHKFTPWPPQQGPRSGRGNHQ